MAMRLVVRRPEPEGDVLVWIRMRSLHPDFFVSWAWVAIYKAKRTADPSRAAKRRFGMTTFFVVGGLRSG